MPLAFQDCRHRSNNSVEIRFPAEGSTKCLNFSSTPNDNSSTAPIFSLGGERRNNSSTPKSLLGDCATANRIPNPSLRKFQTPRDLNRDPSSRADVKKPMTLSPCEKASHRSHPLAGRIL